MLGLTAEEVNGGTASSTSSELLRMSKAGVK